MKGTTRAALLERLFPEGYRFLGDAAASRAAMPGLLRAMRPHQWLKNLLVLAPLAAAHRLTDTAALATGIIAAIGFCLLASATYLLNDMLDIASDRAHPRKRRRPFAAGEVSITGGLAACLALLGGAAATAWLLPSGYALVLLAYAGLTLAYSLRLKQIALVDLFVLSTLYSLRIAAGGVAAAVPLSLWLLGFAMFVFLALAAIKRCAEMGDRRMVGKAAILGRGYRADDLPVIRGFASASSVAAVIVLSLYATRPEVTRLYSNPALLWLIVPLTLYWLLRMMLLTHRGEMHDDPVVFTMRDGKSLAVIAICGVIAVAASHTHLPPSLILPA